MDTNTGTVSFWKRPEGITGKFIIAAGVIAGLAGLYFGLPFINVILDSTIHMVISAGTLAFLAFLVTSERVRAIAFYAFALISRAITSLFVNIDPVAILDEYAKDMKTQKREIDDSISRTSGIDQQLKDEIDRSKDEMADALKKANVAQDQDVLNELTERAGRRQANIEQYTAMLGVVDEVLNQLTRVSKRVQYYINNSEDEKKELIIKNKIAANVDQSVSRAKGVLGYNQKLEMRNMAADRIREKYSNARGELNSLIQIGKNIDGEIDLNSLAFRADGQAKLAELRAKLNQMEGQDTPALPSPTAPKMLGAGNIPQQQQGGKWADRLKVNQ